MLTYKYTAREATSGKKVQSVVQADSEQSAAKILRGQGLSVINIKVYKNTGGVFSKIKNRITTKDKILFSRQLSTLINAGLPLVQSLRSVSNQITNKSFKVVINQVINDIEGGSAFSIALSKHPNVFNEIFVGLIGAGEVSGTLDKALARLADQQEKDAEILSKVRGALIYPAVVIFVMVAVVLFMVLKVLPQVENLYKGIPGVSLPLLTRVLLVFSHLISKYWWIIIIGIGVLGFFTSRWARTLGGKQVVDKIKMKAWPIGPLFMKMYMARFARTANTLIASGVPLLQVLDITSKAINNVHIEASIKKASEKVKGGVALSDAITHDKNFLELVPSMLKIGEQSGAMEDMLAKVADYYEKEVDNQIKAVQTIIEPVLMIVLGIVALIIVAAILLPIYGLAGKDFIH